MKKRTKKVAKKKIGLGDLPVGLTGKMFGVPYKVLIQYDIAGDVSAELYDNGTTGEKIVSVSGNSKSLPAEILQVKQYVNSHQKVWTKIPTADLDSTDKKSSGYWEVAKFVKNLSQEVRDFNSGKNKKLAQKKKLDVKGSSPDKAGKGNRPPKETPPEKHKPKKHKETPPEKNKHHSVPPERNGNGDFVYVKKATAQGLYKVAPKDLFSIGGIEGDILKHFEKASEELKNWNKVLIRLEQMKKEKGNDTIDKIYIRNDIYRVKNMIKETKTHLSELRKLILKNK